MGSSHFTGCRQLTQCWYDGGLQTCAEQHQGLGQIYEAKCMRYTSERRCQASEIDRQCAAAKSAVMCNTMCCPFATQPQMLDQGAITGV